MSVYQPFLWEPLAPLVSPEMPEGATLREKFELFHAANPHIYEELRRMALTLLQRGTKHYGIAALFETLRFNHAIQTRDDEFKLNNNHRAFYARVLMEEEPRLAGFFELRIQRVQDEEEADWTNL